MNNEPAIDLKSYPHAGATPVAVQRLIFGDNDNIPHLMFCGGFHSAMAGNKATALHGFCKSQSWNYTRFDYRGHGQSGGNAVDLTLNDWLDDTLAVLDENEHPTVLIGSSMGAWLATLATMQRPQKVCGLMLLAAAPDFLQELVEPELSPSNIWDLQQGQAINLPSRYEEPYPITQALLDSGKSLSVLNNDMVEKVHCPMRLIHGTADEAVPFSLSIRLMEKMAATDASLTLLNHSDHRLSDERCIEHIQQAVEELVSRCYTI